MLNQSLVQQLFIKLVYASECEGLIKIIAVIKMFVQFDIAERIDADI